MRYLFLCFVSRTFSEPVFGSPPMNHESIHPSPMIYEPVLHPPDVRNNPSTSPQPVMSGPVFPPAYAANGPAISPAHVVIHPQSHLGSVTNPSSLPPAQVMTGGSHFIREPVTSGSFGLHALQGPIINEPFGPHVPRESVTDGSLGPQLPSGPAPHGSVLSPAHFLNGTKYFLTPVLNGTVIAPPSVESNRTSSSPPAKNGTTASSPSSIMKNNTAHSVTQSVNTSTASTPTKSTDHSVSPVKNISEKAKPPYDKSSPSRATQFGLLDSEKYETQIESPNKSTVNLTSKKVSSADAKVPSLNSAGFTNPDGVALSVAAVILVMFNFKGYHYIA